MQYHPVLTAIAVSSALACSSFAIVTAQRSGPDQCDLSKSKAAEEVAATLTNWREMYGTFVVYGDCDDGAIAEGFSESTTSILTVRWSELRELGLLVAKDRKFLEFILRHINETSTEEQLKRIADLSRKSCPSNLADLCRRLEQEAQAALKVMK